MGNRPESMRRKDNCVECKDFKPIKAKNLCQNCWHKVKHRTQPEFHLRQKYSQIAMRCGNKNNKSYFRYKARLQCTREEFLARFKNDAEFLRLFKLWQESNFDYGLVPSVDRIDNTKGYTIDNMQFLTHSDNSLKDQELTPIVVLTKQLEFIAEYESQASAEKATGVPQSNLWKVCNKQRKSAGGLVFMYKEDYESST